MEKPVLVQKANVGKWFGRGQTLVGCMVGARVVHGGRVSQRPRVVNVAQPVFERYFAMPLSATTSPVWAGPGRIICNISPWLFFWMCGWSFMTNSFTFPLGARGGPNPVGGEPKGGETLAKGTMVRRSIVKAL